MPASPLLEGLSARDFRELATEAVPQRIARALLRLVAADPEGKDAGIVKAGRGQVVVQSLARLRGIAEAAANTAAR